MTVCCKCDTAYQTGNTVAHALCYQAVMLFVYIAMSYDEVWECFGSDLQAVMPLLIAALC